MPIIKQKEWDNHVKINDDPYGSACVKVAQRYWMKNPGSLIAIKLFVKQKTKAALMG